ncbi:MAG: HAD family phosphatase [Deltaproteobacteria bacterium]|nr:HAD family phosphatase [Deltaproteobacteria bacterium]
MNASDLGNIKNIIFDLGGVILNIDHTLTEKCFAKFGIKNLFAHYKTLTEDNYFDHFECGRISADEFAAKLCADFGAEIERELFVSAWNALLQDLPVERVRALESVKERYRTFLLSNTNEIHIDSFHSYMQTSFGYPDLSHLFEKVYYSCRIGARKPDQEIFRIVLSDAGMNAHETLFLDDSGSNVASARAVGLHAVQIAGEVDLLSVLSGLRGV